MTKSASDNPRRRRGASRAPRPYATAFHAPVLCEEVVRRLVTDPDGTYVDATLGGGGHTAALLDALDADGRVIGLDRDADALEATRDRLADAVEEKRLRLLRGTFAELDQLLKRHRLRPVDGVLLDLGVSSHQIDTPGRGFSYRAEGPLDMRMDARSGLTAEQVVNRWSEGDLRQALYDYGEESRSRRIARAIAEARPLETTAELADIIRQAVPTRDEVSTLSRVFQAIRIAVNGELEALELALRAGPHVLAPGGRMTVISYHSLEDRRVKRFFRYGNMEGKPVRDLYGNLLTPWNELTHKPIRADEAEVAANTRARSARLRVADRKDELPDQMKENVRT